MRGSTEFSGFASQGCSFVVVDAEQEITWLLTSLALSIERLYRLRYLHRGTHRVRTAVELVQLLWLSLSRPGPADTS